MYELENIGFAYGPKTIIADLSLTFETGHFYGIIGPNGSGKTTLIDLLAGHIRPHCGTITLNGRSLEHCSRKFLARRIALVPQDFRINFPYTCGEIVMMGRYPHIPRFARPGDQDRAVVKRSCNRPAWAISCTVTSPNSAAENVSGWYLPAALPRIHPYCCWTRPPQIWTCGIPSLC
jgi:ABC-type cobalamin/Fe3+-siderophores transport system ATPase subunit